MVVVVVLVLALVGYPSRTTQLPLVVSLQTRGLGCKQDLVADLLLNWSEPNGYSQLPQQVAYCLRELDLT